MVISGQCTFCQHTVGAGKRSHCMQIQRNSEHIGTLCHHNHALTGLQLITDSVEYFWNLTTHMWPSPMKPALSHILGILRCIYFGRYFDVYGGILRCVYVFKLQPLLITLVPKWRQLYIMYWSCGYLKLLSIVSVTAILRKWPWKIVHHFAHFP